MTRLLAVLLLCSGLALAQKNAPATPVKPAPPDPFAVNVFGGSWEAGELRACSTYWQFTDFLLCDDDLHAKVRDATIQKGDPYHMLLSASIHSKRFVVQFSKLPWKLAPPDPDKKSDEPVFANPDYRSPNMESRWDCSKEKMISCKFLTSF